MRGEITAFQEQLVSWFHNARRDLPWRRHRSVYHTVVSEFMLQQTQVDTVIAFFNRWIAAFPDFQSLATAPEQRVLKHWEGLGYYSRARNLHKLAKTVAARKSLPASATEWQQLPGVGPYTAAAIVSIGQGQPAPLIDGNVIRVFSRLHNDPTPIPSASAAQKHFRPIAEALLNHHNPGDHNEALMELGATICLKTRPLCLLCPVRQHCQAAASGNPEDLPVIPRKTARQRTVQRLFLFRRNRLLLTTYPPDARRLANISELPELPAHLARQAVPVTTRRRTISSERITEEIFTLPDGAQLDTLPDDSHWVTIDELDQLTLSAPHSKWLRELLANSDPDDQRR